MERILIVRKFKANKKVMMVKVIIVVRKKVLRLTYHSRIQALRKNQRNIKKNKNCHMIVDHICKSNRKD